MRKIFIVTLGLVSLGVSTELALARQATCKQAYNKCWRAMEGTGENSTFCGARVAKCFEDGSWGTFAGPGTFRKQVKGNTSVPNGTTPAPSKTSTAIAAPARASTAAASAGMSPGAIVRDHRRDTPRIPVAGGPPPAAPKGTVSTPTNTTDNSPVVRDHRPGGNAANKHK
jgi:hypothetical protein